MRLRSPLLLLLCALACRTTVPANSIPASAVRVVGLADSAAHVAQPSPSYGFERSYRGVVRQPSELEALWQRFDRPAVDWRPARPRIDFQREMLVVVGAGTFGGTGPAIWIDSVLGVRHELIVFVRTASCDGPWFGGHSVTAPVDMVRVPTGFSQIRFIEHQTSFPGCLSSAKP